MTLEDGKKPCAELQPTVTSTFDVSPVSQKLRPKEFEEISALLPDPKAAQQDAIQPQRRSERKVSTNALSNRANTTNFDAKPERRDLNQEELAQLWNTISEESRDEFLRTHSTDKSSRNVQSVSDPQSKLSFLCLKYGFFLVGFVVATSFALSVGCLYSDKPFIKELVKDYIVHICVPLVASAATFLSVSNTVRSSDVKQSPKKKPGKRSSKIK